MIAKNPFTPTFGTSPPLLVGRDPLIEEFADALEDGPGAPGRATLYTGARGSGKTVLLNEVEDRAQAAGWLVVSETATPGVLNRITGQALPGLLRSFDPEAVKAHLTGISLPIISGGVDWTVAERHVADRGVRNQIELLTDLLREHEAGLLITLDEVHRNQISDLRELATAVQHAFREERDVAFVAAGLQSSVSDLLNDDVLTFLRRADKHHLGKVAETDVVAALTEPIATAGKTVDEDALLPMVEGTGGYAFLIQLIGYHSWRSAVDKDAIAAADATVGVARAFRRLGSLVHEPALHNVSAVSKSFLVAMAKDDGPSKMGDIQERLGVTQVYASQYRLRLIDAELIEPAGHGHVDFSLPHMREYLREHAVSDL